MRRRRLIFAAVFLLGGACKTQPPPRWAPQSLGPCSRGTGSEALDRQRSFLSALLALDARKYVILQNEFPDRLVGHYVSEYKPDTYQTRWVLAVQRDAKIEIAAASPYDAAHSKTPSWFLKLTNEIRRYQCRELEWLSWRAENLGLIPIGLGVHASESEPRGEGTP